MSAEDSLHDVTIRENQLHKHLLNSPEYLRRADQELKRQVTILYLAIALLMVFQGLFTFASGALPLSGVALVSVTSFLAIVNCLLLIKTKTWLHRLNEEWLGPQEKTAVNALRFQREQILTELPEPSAAKSRAELN